MISALKIRPTYTKLSADNPRVGHCVEILCNAGCARVRETIALLQRGESVDILQSLTAEERNMVLKELKSIMAVYDG